MASITISSPKQLMMATRMAIGVWPPPDAIQEMNNQAALVAVACCDLAILGNMLGFFSLLPNAIPLSVTCVYVVVGV